MASSRSINSPTSISLSRSSALGRQTTPSLKKTLQLYKAQLHRLEAKHEQLLQKREDINSRGFLVVDEGPTASARPARHTIAATGRRSGEAPKINVLEASAQVERSPSPIQLREEPGKLKPPPQDGMSLIEQPDALHSDVNTLVSTATNILIESLELQLGFIREIISKLNTLYQEQPKSPTPPELGYHRYDEWVGSNQRLLELNAQLYEIERLKFELKRKKSLVRKVRKSGHGEEAGLAGSLLLKSSVQRIQSFMSRFTFETPVQDRTATYLQELLNPRGDRTTLEAQKIQEYVTMCMDNMDTPEDTVIGAHPQTYQQFMAVLCSYIVEKQREVQGEQLPHALVYSTVERHLIPKILPAMMRHVSVSERDSIIEKQCDQFASVTLSQLKIKEKLRSDELVPFFESITQLRASYFSPTPTDKMYAVVAASKALYERLGAMGESSIDGDTFLDLWVYVILKAKVKDLASNLQFMAEYGNPMLAMDEAGYYLTSLEAAVTFIESLEPSQLGISGVPTDYVVCECSKFQELSLHPAACFEVISHRAELPGYRVGVVRQWALNRAKLVSAVLVKTEDPNDVAIVSVIRFSLDHTCAHHTEYFTDSLKLVGQTHEGLSCSATPLGMAVTADTANLNPHNILVLPTGDFDTHYLQLTHLLQLIRLGSEEREDVSQFTLGTSPQSVDDGFLYIQTLKSSPHTLFSSKNRNRLNSDGAQLANGRTVPVDARRVASFTESTSPPSPYLFGMESQVSLDTLPSSSYMKHSRVQQGKQSWFGRRFRSRKEKRDREERHKDVYTQYPDFGGEITREYPSPKAKYPDFSGGITREYPSSKSKYTVSGNKHTSSDGYSSVFSADNSPIHSNVQTVEVEVHESINATHPLDRVVLNGKSKSSVGFQNALFDTSTEFGDQGEGQKVDQKSLGDVHASLHPPSDVSEEEATKSEKTSLGTGDVQTSSITSQLSCLLAEDPFLKVSYHFFSEEHARFLEGNFVVNHMIAGDPESMGVVMKMVIKQTQLFLQRLNYLSISHKLDGVYSDVTLNAVQRFQVAHNRHKGLHIIPLVENGVLTAACFQYLRQGFLTIYASMIRLGMDKHLGVNFDPTSTDDREVNLFKECVRKFQESRDLIGRCQVGVLCTNTVEKIRHVLRSKRYTK